MVGSTSGDLESDGHEDLELNILKKDANTILAQHSYAHPYSYLQDKVNSDSSNKCEKVKMEESCYPDDENIYLDDCDENECVTVVISSEDEDIMESSDVDCSLGLQESCLNIKSEKMDLLSPYNSFDSLSPSSSCKDPSSPAMYSPDFAYESVESPLSDIPDFDSLWSESFSELFPSLV